MNRKNICALIKEALCGLDLYKALPTCSDKVKSRIVELFVRVRVQYALKFKS